MNFLYIKLSEIKDTSSKNFYAIFSEERAIEALQDHSLKTGLQLSAVLEKTGRGKATILSCTSEKIELSLLIDCPLPERMPIDLVVAYCRPQTVKKLIHLAASLGLRSLSFVKTANVVASYLQSKSLTTTEVARQIRLGLEQAGDGVAPEINHFQRLSAFLESDIIKLRTGSKLFGDISALSSLSGVGNSDSLLFLGPESGFIIEEKESLLASNFETISMGPRVLRLEVAAAVLLGKLL